MATVSLAEYGKLKEDFEYNLKLLEERDLELQNYETTFVHFKSILRERDETISSNARTIEGMQTKLGQLSASSSEHDQRHREEISLLRTQLQHTVSQHENYLRKLRSEMDEMRRQASSELLTLKEACDKQLQEAHEINLKVERETHELTLKNSGLSRELQSFQARLAQAERKEGIAAARLEEETRKLLEKDSELLKLSNSRELDRTRKKDADAQMQRLEQVWLLPHCALSCLHYRTALLPRGCNHAARCVQELKHFHSLKASLVAEFQATSPLVACLLICFLAGQAKIAALLAHSENTEAGFHKQLAATRAEVRSLAYRRFTHITI
jgi:hypothetical protein